MVAERAWVRIGATVSPRLARTIGRLGQRQCLSSELDCGVKVESFGGLTGQCWVLDEHLVSQLNDLMKSCLNYLSRLSASRALASETWTCWLMLCLEISDLVGVVTLAKGHVITWLSPEHQAEKRFE